MGRHRSKHRRPRGRLLPPASLLLSLGSAVIVVLIVLGAVAMANRGHGPAAQNPPTVPFSPQPSLLIERSPSPSPSASAPVTPRPPPTARPPTVLLRWTGGRSWIRVTGPGKKVLLVGVLPRFTVKSFTGTSFFIEIGDAGNLTVTIRGGNPHLAGKPGQVARFAVTGP